MTLLSVLLATLTSGLVVSHAQLPPVPPPFFGGPGPVAYNPEPAAVFSGHSLHAQAVVSADRKYVNLNLSASQSAVSGVQVFPIYFAGGFVGSSNPFGSTANTSNGLREDPGIKGSSPEAELLVSKSAPLEGVLGVQGMTRLVRFD